MDLQNLSKKQLKDLTVNEIFYCMENYLFHNVHTLANELNRRDKFREVLPQSIIELTKEAQVDYKTHGYDIKQLTIKSTFAKTQTHVSYNVREMPYAIKSYEIKKVIKDGIDYSWLNDI